MGTKKTLVKCKIVAVDWREGGVDTVTLFWKKTFWIFGYWYPFGVTTGGCKDMESLEKSINDVSISEIIYDKILSETR